MVSKQLKEIRASCIYLIEGAARIIQFPFVMGKTGLMLVLGLIEGGGAASNGIGDWAEKNAKRIES